MMNDDRPIILIGYRATGKTTIGQLLAQALGWTFVDADVLLEARYGKTIREMFATEGEQIFRDRESAILRELSRTSRHVIATGGGVIMRSENREQLREAIVVWLKASPTILHSRIEHDPTTTERRPNLTNMGGLREITQLLALREPLYAECAHHTIDTESRSPEELVGDILSLVTGERPA